MFFIPLSQIESVDLVIHALRSAGGQADCKTCPARKVCTRQCLTIADSVSRMIEEGTLPNLGLEASLSDVNDGEEEPEAPEESNAPRKGASHLKVVK